MMPRPYSISISIVVIILLPVLFGVLCDVELFSMLAFSWEGMKYTLHPILLAAYKRLIKVSKDKPMCYKYDPWILRTLVERLEKSLENDHTHANSTPVREVDFFNGEPYHAKACHETLLSTQGGRLSPFIARANKTFIEFSPEWLMSKFGNYSVLATDMKAFDENVHDIASCPWKRRPLSRRVLLQDMYEQPKFYANFNKDTLGNIYDTMKQNDNSSSDYFQFIDNQLHQMCDVFDGIDGELFFGWTSPETISGVGFHCAVMENIFFQGE